MDKEVYPLMSFNDAKRLIKAHDIHKMYMRGMSVRLIAREEGMPREDVRKCIDRIDGYIRKGVLDEKLRDARVTFGWTWYEITNKKPKEKLPVRSMSGCRFSPLY